MFFYFAGGARTHIAEKLGAEIQQAAAVGVNCKSFGQAFSKACGLLGRNPDPCPAGHGTPCLGSAPRGVNFLQRRKEGSPCKRGTPLERHCLSGCLF